MKSYIISAVLPYHKVDFRLVRSIRSVLNQTVSSRIQLIIVGPLEEKEFEKFANENGLDLDRPLASWKHVYSKDDNVSEARNIGIEKSDGEYVSFLDSDDEWYSKKTSLTLRKFRNSEIDPGLVYTWRRLKTEDDREIGKIKPTLKGEVNPLSFPSTHLSTITIRKECVEKIGFFDEDLSSSEDREFKSRMAREFRWDYVPKLLVNQFFHSSSLTAKNFASDEKLQNLECAFRKIIRNMDVEDSDKLLSRLYRRKAAICFLGGNFERSKREARKSYLLNNRRFDSFIIELISNMKSFARKPIISFLRSHGYLVGKFIGYPKLKADVQKIKI